jgi:hypothetical protein
MAEGWAGFFVLGFCAVLDFGNTLPVWMTEWLWVTGALPFFGAAFVGACAETVPAAALPSSAGFAISSTVCRW